MAMSNRERVGKVLESAVRRVPLGWAVPKTVCHLGTRSAGRRERNRGTDVRPNPCGVETPGCQPKPPHL